jgi:hypothetical protein
MLLVAVIFVFDPSLPLLSSLSHGCCVLSGMFSDGFFSYGIEPVRNGSHQVGRALWCAMLKTLGKNGFMV